MATTTGSPSKRIAPKKRTPSTGTASRASLEKETREWVRLMKLAEGRKVAAERLTLADAERLFNNYLDRVDGEYSLMTLTVHNSLERLELVRKALAQVLDYYAVDAAWRRAKTTRRPATKPSP